MIKLAKNNSGFTLIEATISLAVLGIGILALFAMQTISVKGNANAKRVSTMAQWGSDEIEQFLPDKYKNIVDKDPVNVSGDGTYTVSRTITEDSPMKNIKTIVVTVTNVHNGKQMILRYLKANDKAL